jgi:rod shape determining protein RodA
MTYGYSTSVSRRRDLTARATKSTYLRRLDWTLLIAALSLSGLGALLVWSATKQRQLDANLDPESFLKKHLLNLAIGLLLGFVVSKFDYRLLRAYTPILYVGSILGLVAVLAVGATVNGAHAWIALPAGFTLQPSEFAKLAIILGMAMILSEKRDAEPEPKDRDVVLALLLAAIPAALIMLQPDLGTVMVIFTIVVGVLAVSGARSRWTLGLLLGTVLVAGLAIHFDVIRPYQVDRLTAFADPNSGSSSYGYNTQQSRIAIGSGGLTGQGLFKGAQTQGKFVPENQTDFVYSVAGEELGFVGSAAIILLLGVILWRGFVIASRASDLFGRLVATGIICWFAFQAFENIGMNLGIMPVTGVPLPFVSYGGSSMFAGWMAIGLLQNIHLRRSD